MYGQEHQNTLLFVSEYALYPPYLRAAEILAHEYDLNCHVIAPYRYDVPKVYDKSGILGFHNFDCKTTPLDVHFLDAHKGNVEMYGFCKETFRETVNLIKPVYIWIQSEFWQGISHQILTYYRFNKVPKIIAKVEINHLKSRSLFSFKAPFIRRSRLIQMLLWSRLNGINAANKKAADCARNIGLPKTVPVRVTYVPVFGPDYDNGESIGLPWRNDGSVIVGFVGRLCEQKGWKYLLNALEILPEGYKVVVLGDGEQRTDLIAWMARERLKGRVYYAGVISKRDLYASYKLFDVLVLPSITTTYSVEQFGTVCAEAMACGVPVVASNSGGIPDTVGNAGIIVAEGDVEALAGAIMKVGTEEGTKKELMALGQERYKNIFSCDAFAHSIAGIFGLT